MNCAEAKFLCSIRQVSGPLVLGYMVINSDTVHQSHSIRFDYLDSKDCWTLKSLFDDMRQGTDAKTEKEYTDSFVRLMKC